MKRPNSLLICLLILGIMPMAGAATFNVSNPTEFQNALTAAAANNENDTIIVVAGTYTISSPFTGRKKLQGSRLDNGPSQRRE